jgi:serine protease Do
MKKRMVVLVGLVVLAVLALSGCGGPSASVQALAVDTASPVATAAVPVEAADLPASQQTADGTLIAAFEGTLEQVNIQVEQQVDTIGGSGIPGFDFPFQNPGLQGPQVQQGLGSGFVWDTQGHIVTNNHVVDGADKITVTFYDSTQVPATVVGVDPDSDLAVVKVDLPADQLVPVEIADSSEVHVGELAIAIGNPFGLEGTMTAGIISALGRSLPVESGLQAPTYTIPDIIQTDAPINPGNSGGVLLDDSGRVIGVTAAIESTAGSNAGIGFAIPSNIVTKVVPALITSGHYDHPWVGISGTTLIPAVAEAMGLDAGQRGALVIEVVTDSPAESAGLRGGDREVTLEDGQAQVGGDVIVAVDGQPIKEFDDLIAYLARSTEVGQTINLTVLRDGQEEQVALTLGARPTSNSQQSEESSATPGNPAATGAYLGIVGITVSPEIAQAMDLSAEQEGVLVEEVQADSAAELAGLRAGDESVTIQGQQVQVGGDVITAIDGQTMASIQDLRAWLQQAEPGQQVRLTILRDGELQQIPVILGQSPAATP